MVLKEEVREAPREAVVARAKHRPLKVEIQPIVAKVKEMLLKEIRELKDKKPLVAKPKKEQEVLLREMTQKLISMRLEISIIITLSKEKSFTRMSDR